MVDRPSRYRQLPNDLTINPQGQQQLSKSLRLLPRVTGELRHFVQAGDRLDHLAAKYYDQPTKWWQICDANPEFLSPLALLGKTPRVTLRFPVTFKGAGDPPWAKVLQALQATVGVLDAWLEDDETFITVIFNQHNVQLANLAQTIKAEGFEVAEPQPIGRVGKLIVIPPNSRVIT